jgi:hypothetical protein
MLWHVNVFTIIDWLNVEWNFKNILWCLLFESGRRTSFARSYVKALKWSNKCMQTMYVHFKLVCIFLFVLVFFYKLCRTTSNAFFIIQTGYKDILELCQITLNHAQSRLFHWVKRNTISKFYRWSQTSIAHSPSYFYFLNKLLNEKLWDKSRSRDN